MRRSFLEIMSPGNSKWRALSLIAMEGHTSEQVILRRRGQRFRDDHPRRPGGGWAIPSVKAVAQYVTHSNEEDGVAHVVEQFVLKEM
jgi:hydroxymethylpyrimidine pyrophosphatase-like HAD family hydrolase